MKDVSAMLDTSWIATSADLAQLDAINAPMTEEFNTSKYAKESQLPQQEESHPDPFSELTSDTSQAS